jgi:pimeloyl-ACP methyl ester carboxylesterase
MPGASVTTGLTERAPRRIFYLHGFASSPQSKKAAYFAERFHGHGLSLECPDFNEPDFPSLTMTRMIDQLGREIGRVESGPIALIGSSLGGVVALHAAARFPDRIDRLVLLAPALTFAKEGHRFLGPERVAEWRAKGTIDVFHFGAGGTRPLNYSFYEDSLQYDALGVVLEQPTLIFQGLHDEAVDYRTVEQYTAIRANATLSLLNDDHQLISSLPRIWDDIEPFLGLVA